MKIAILAFAFAILAASAYVAAGSELNTVDAAIRAELTAVVEAWIEAEVQGDREGLENILDKDFLSTFASGATLDRSAYIDFIINLDISPFKVNNQSMAQHGDTVVVIDVSESGTTKFTWIAVRRDTHWKVISQTFSKVEAAELE
jgi:hypothetical protein